MNECENFERDYQRYRSGDLPLQTSEAHARHLALCPHCAAYSGAHDSVRTLLGAAPLYQPASGFEDRLRARRIEGVRKSVGNHRRFPVSLPAIGAGLATGFAIGFFALFTPDSTDSIPGVPAAVVADAGLKEKADTVKSDRDSIQTPTTGYQLDRRSRLVSGGR